MGNLNMLAIIQYDEEKHRRKDIIDYVEKSVGREPQAGWAAQKTKKESQKEGLPKGQEYSPESGRPMDRPANKFIQTNKNIFWYDPDVICLESHDEEDKQASREETPTEVKDCITIRATTNQEEVSRHPASLGGIGVIKEGKTNNDERKAERLTGPRLNGKRARVSLKKGLKKG